MMLDINVLCVTAVYPQWIETKIQKKFASTGKVFCCVLPSDSYGIQR